MLTQLGFPLKKLKGVDGVLIDAMLKEAGLVHAKVGEWKSFNDKSSLKDNVALAWDFWCSLKKERAIDAWWTAVEIVAVLQPCSIDA